MRPGTAVLAMLLALPAVALRSADGSPQPLSPAAAPSAEDFVAGSAEGLDAVLSLLDGGALTQALRKLARSGAPLRLILDPAHAESRREGAALAALTPSAQLRWAEGAGQPLRRLIGRQGSQLVWRAGKAPSRADGAHGLAQGRFEAAWQAATAELPAGLRLEDELKRLPDPSEDQPHFIRRREAAAREEDHANPQDP